MPAMKLTRGNKGTNIKFTEKTSGTVSQKSTRTEEDNKMVDFSDRASEDRMEIVFCLKCVPNTRFR